MSDYDDPKLIVLRVAHLRPGGMRSGKRLFAAEYPFKAYVETGKTRQEALGRLLLRVADYLDIRIEDRT